MLFTPPPPPSQIKIQDCHLLRILCAHLISDYFFKEIKNLYVQKPDSFVVTLRSCPFGHRLLCALGARRVTSSKISNSYISSVSTSSYKTHILFVLYVPNCTLFLVKNLMTTGLWKIKATYVGDSSHAKRSRYPCNCCLSKERSLLVKVY